MEIGGQGDDFVWGHTGSTGQGYSRGYLLLVQDRGLCTAVWELNTCVITASWMEGGFAINNFFGPLGEKF